MAQPGFTRQGAGTRRDGDVMQVRLTVEGRTMLALQERMDAALASFLTGAPGAQAVLSQVTPATKVRDEPAGFQGGEVLTLPVYSLEHVYDVTSEAPEG